MCTGEMDTILRSSTFTTSIMGVEVEVKTTVKGTYETTFDFTLHGDPYTFVITKWSRRGFAKLGTLFFNAAGRDADIFGVFSEATDGTVSFSMDTEQKVNVVEQAVKDVIATIDKIGIHHKRAVLDYAVWYREKHQEMTTYAEYITWVACCAIVHVNFMAPNVSWEVVKFSM